MNAKRIQHLLLALMVGLFGLTGALADGNETLGTPSVTIADGTQVVGNGIGLGTQPATITFDVPGGATVQQVLLYWNGFHTLPGNGDDTIVLDAGGGAVPVTGTMIGGPELFFNNNYASTYRADITDLGMVTVGTNNIEVSGGDFDQITNGASIVAIIDDGGQSKVIQLKDGQDLAFINFAPTLDTTVAQTYTFMAADVDRDAQLLIVAGSVEGNESGGTPIRPNVIRVIAGELVVDIVDPLASNNGEEWDHIVLPIVIPSGVSEISVQALSIEDGTDNLPASFCWIASMVSFPEPYCGDEMLNTNESCDPPGSVVGPNDSLCREDCTFCGDNLINGGEACDDGNAIPGDGCENDCTMSPFCGDGVVNQEFETCDPAGVPAGASDNLCREDCTVCGDSVVDLGEECDDGNSIEGDGCENDCTVTPFCGDENVDPELGETCDPVGTPSGPNNNPCREDCTFCGDNVIDFGEACDDGNAIPGDGCENDCTPTAFCGDENVDPELDESCDPPGMPAGNNGNDCREDCTVCGDANVDPGEACDDGNGVNGDGCENDCTMTPFCGDETVDPELGETCDPPGMPSGPNMNICSDMCYFCGDGKVDAGEECDDGNSDPSDMCSNDCTLTHCGNGEMEPELGETCDPPGSPSGLTGNPCRDDCTFCGDANTDPGEACDDGNAIGGDGCENDCTLSPTCGDGEVNQEHETCDPAGTPAGANDNLCREDCTVCGDNVIDFGEACDDGNSVGGDGCENDCTLSPTCGDGEVNQEHETCDPAGTPAGANDNLCREDCTVCGDNVVDFGEACDDGNSINGDGCENDCTESPTCGDGEVNQEDETCDPAGTPAGANDNLCREDCTVCGDGVTDPAEECDDGNSEGGDGCENDCTASPICGDEQMTPEIGETCDPPGTPMGEAGNLCRNDCTFCGDGEVNGDEECDDGNMVLGDGCTPECRDETRCDLEVQKLCYVEPDGTDGSSDDCDGSVIGMKLLYTGEGCAAGNNPQSGKAQCTGGAGFAEPVHIVVSNERGNKIYADELSVFVGDVIDVTAEAAGFNALASQTRALIDGDLEYVSLHTSCSKPLSVGDQFGSLKVIELTTSGGGTVTLPEEPEPGEGSTECHITPAPPAPHCEGRIQVLELEYLGGDCFDTTNTQSGGFRCEGVAGATEPVRFVCEGHGGVYLDSGAADVFLGDVVTIDAADTGLARIGPQTDCTIYDEFDNFVQFLSIHTSCSQPLDLGDRFGSVRVVGMDTTASGMMSLETEVIYTYKIWNHSVVAATDVTVVDDKLGEISGSPIPVIEPDGMVVLQAAAMISETTTNTVTVNGELESGAVCDEVTASATVHGADPDDGNGDDQEPQVCLNGTQSLLLKYTGPRTEHKIRVWIGADGLGQTIEYYFNRGLRPGDVLTLGSEGGWTVDAVSHGNEILGPVTTIEIEGGAVESLDTSCGRERLDGAPAPLEQADRTSHLWMIMDYVDR